MKIYKKGNLELGEINLVVDDANLGIADFANHELVSEEIANKEITYFKLKETETPRIPILCKIFKSKKSIPNTIFAFN